MSQILLYQSEDGRTKLDVRLENQTLWLNQKQLTELFGKPRGPSASTSSTSLRTGNWKKFQLFGYSEQLPLTARSTRFPITIWTWC